METELIIKIIMGLIVVLAILIFLLFLEPDQDSPEKKTIFNNKHEDKVEEKITDTDLESLLKIIKNKKSSEDKIREALDLIIKYHGTVHTKLGLRPHPDFDIYMDIIFTACRHPNVNKDIIVNFDRRLTRLNPEYKKEINDALEKGLTSRRV